MSHLLVRGIVSGGQTGVDRAALEVAGRVGLPAGGWCPAGRLAEDGVIPARYRLRETPSAANEQRTAWNVFDTDATLILARVEPTGGTALAVAVAEGTSRPLRRIATGSSVEIEAIRSWLAEFPAPPLLNVAGPRESDDPGVADWATGVLTQLLVAAFRPATEYELSPRALVTGARGYLGSHLMRLAPPGWEAIGVVRPTPAGPPGTGNHGGAALGPEAGRSAAAEEPFTRGSATVPVELSDGEAVRAAWSSIRPKLVIHTAYSMDAGERDIWEATRNVVDASSEVGADLIHISSDMVLDGENAPFDESSPAAPVHEYGRWKARAEDYVLERYPSAAIVRASLLTAFDPPDPRTTWVLAGLRGEREVRLFVDEIRTPILITDLARQIWEIARLDSAKRAGVWHLAGPESVSRYALGLMIAAAWKLDARAVIPAVSAELPEPRPRDLRLLVGRAERELLTRAQPLSVAIARAAAGER